jgi:hypothetical protein
LSYSRFSELFEVGRDWPKKELPGGSSSKSERKEVNAMLKLRNVEMKKRSPAGCHAPV